MEGAPRARSLSHSCGTATIGLEALRKPPPWVSTSLLAGTAQCHFNYEAEHMEAARHLQQSLSLPAPAQPPAKSDQSLASNGALQGGGDVRTGARAGQPEAMDQQATLDYTFLSIHKP